MALQTVLTIALAFLAISVGTGTASAQVPGASMSVDTLATRLARWYGEPDVDNLARRAVAEERANEPLTGEQAARIVLSVSRRKAANAVARSEADLETLAFLVGFAGVEMTAGEYVSETIALGASLRILDELGLNDVARQRLRTAVRDRMIHVDHANRALLYYELNRDTYPSFEAYVPSLIASFRHARAMDTLPEFWMWIDDYFVAGPFDLGWDGTEITHTVTPGFERAWPPETEPDTSTVFETVDGELAWRRAAADARHHVDLREYFTTRDNVVCYARAVVVAPRNMSAKLSLGSNDASKLRLNGTWIASALKDNEARPHEVVVPVALREGANEVLVKVRNLGLGWGLYLAVLDPDRELTVVAHESLLDQEGGR